MSDKEAWGHAAVSEPKIILLVRLLNAIDEARHNFEGLKTYIAEGEHPPSTRSMRRYLAELANAGYPWYFDRASDTYRFASSYSLKKMNLNNSELFGVVALRSFGQRLGGALGAGLNELTDKLMGSTGRIAGATSMSVRIPNVDLDAASEKAFEQLNAARDSSRSVRFSYTDKLSRPSKRTADPYAFVIHGGRVYCIAFDHDRREKRSFAIDSITDLNTLATTFVRPPDFDVERDTADSISGLLTEGELEEIKVRFDPQIAKAALAARVVANQTVARCLDGSVEIVYRVRNVPELLRFVLGWGTEAQIIEPTSARASMANLAIGIAKHYLGKDGALTSVSLGLPLQPDV